MTARPDRPDLDEIQKRVDRICSEPWRFTRLDNGAWEFSGPDDVVDKLTDLPYDVDLLIVYAQQLEQGAAGLRETLESMVNQFAYPNVVKGQPAICTGGLSALEEAFDVLGLDDPHILEAAP